MECSFSSKYEMFSFLSIEAETVFTKVEMHNKWNVNV